MADDFTHERAALEKTLEARAEALRQAEGRVQALFDQSPLNILVLAVSALGLVTVEECNATFCRNAGITGDQVAGKPIEAVLGEAGAVLARDCRTAIIKGGFDCQHVLRFHAGERVLRSYYQPLPPAPRSARRVLLSQVDLTESCRVETTLRHATRLEAIGQLTGGVAHEFNNLLTAVLGSLDLLSRRLADERQLRWVEIATSAAQRGALLTNQLLAYARKQFMAPAATDIPATLGNMMELIRGSLGSRVALLTAFDPDTWPVLADPAQLELAVLNLLVNARDAMPNGGRVTLSTVNRPVEHPDLPAELEPGDYVRLAVADTGIGMTPEVLAQSVEPFFTTKAFGQGSGLGLPQAFGVARQLGGTLRLHSTPGEGTVAHIFLPRIDAMGSAASMPLLVVDDDEDVRSIAAALLREEGWTVQEAASGAEALRVLATEPFAALLADLAMPGMSGVDLAKAAMAAQPGLPVVFLTGNVDRELLGALPGPVLSKPYSVDALLSVVRTAVRGIAP